MTILNDDELRNYIWKKIHKALSADLEVARKKNDGNLSEFETATLRGEIKQIKKILAWGDTPPEYESEDPGII